MKNPFVRLTLENREKTIWVNMNDVPVIRLTEDGSTVLGGYIVKESPDEIISLINENNR